MRDLGDLTERAEAERARYRSALVVMKGSQQKRAASLLTERQRHEATIGDLRKEATERIEAKRATIARQRAAEVERLRATLGDVMTETGHTRYSTRAGVAAVTSPSTVVSYDGKALDALCKSDAEWALKLFPHRQERQRAGTKRGPLHQAGATERFPHRQERQRAGTLRITAAKGTP